MSRRRFVTGSAAVVGGLAVGATAGASGAGVTPAVAPSPAKRGPRRRMQTLRVAVIGCGGRGTGAAFDALAADEGTRIVGLADLFAHRVEGCRAELVKHHADRATVPTEQCFDGFDAYERLLERVECDYVVLASPPGFRPWHFVRAIEAGRHVFFEKPVAVDPAGCRRVIEAGDEAEKQGLSIVTGTQRRHEETYLAAMAKVRAGAIGPVVGASCFWNQGGLWVHERTPEYSDVEWQVRNWLYFTYLSGDHIVEQHVHNLDVLNWALGSAPLAARGSGGRQVRTEGKFGNIFDHFAVELEYPGGVSAWSMCRQIDGCESRVEEVIVGAEGRLTTRPGFAVIHDRSGREVWKALPNTKSPYVQEHVDLIASIRGTGPSLNEAKRVAESTLTAVMARTSAYTGKRVTWQAMLESGQDLMPRDLAFGPRAVEPVAVPGRTEIG